MGAVDVKSASITNLDATPRVATQSGVGAPYRLLELDDYVSAADTDDAASIYRILRVPSTIRMKELWLECSALGGSCAGDVGLYYANRAEEVGAGKTPGAVIDVDFFASAVVMSSALQPVNVLSEGGFYTVDERSMPLWQAAGLATDPGGKFDICVTLTVACDTAGKIYLRAGYGE